jgi:demethylmenaquinone methyltransferase/2-methoxy-6-polyprenyl-1,4-benzoquinol methylase
MTAVPAGKSKAQYIHGMFNDLSAKYDQASTFIAFKQDRFWRDFAASLVDGCGAKVLDVCCGTGEFSIRLKKQTGKEVYGVDFSQGMVSNAKTKYGGSGVDFSIADAQNLPFPNDAFSCVTVSFALRNVTDIKKTITEMTRVLKKGGKIIILDLGKPKSKVYRTFYYWYFYHIAPKLGGAIANQGSYAYKYLPHSLTNFPAQDGIKQIMDEIGLSNIEVYDLTKGIAAVHVGTKSG